MAGKTIASKTGQVRYSVPGPIGPLVYPAGEYDAATRYIRTALSAPMVLDDGQYYVLNKEGAFTGIRPKDDYAANGSKATWVLMEYVKYAFVEVLMANFAKLASAVFYENVMMSQQGVDENGQASSDYQKYNQFKVNPSGGEAIRAFTPNMLLDFLTGTLKAKKAEIEGSITIRNQFVEYTEMEVPATWNPDTDSQFVCIECPGIGTTISNILRLPGPSTVKNVVISIYPYAISRNREEIQINVGASGLMSYKGVSYLNYKLPTDEITEVASVNRGGSYVWVVKNPKEENFFNT